MESESTRLRARVGAAPHQHGTPRLPRVDETADGRLHLQRRQRDKLLGCCTCGGEERREGRREQFMREPGRTPQGGQHAVAHPRADSVRSHTPGRT
eukprot:6317735-Prymnesium_polylepis.1